MRKHKNTFFAWWGENCNFVTTFPFTFLWKCIKVRILLTYFHMADFCTAVQIWQTVAWVRHEIYVAGWTQKLQFWPHHAKKVISCFHILAPKACSYYMAQISHHNLLIFTRSNTHFYLFWLQNGRFKFNKDWPSTTTVKLYH